MRIFLWYNKHNEFELSKGASKMKKRILYFLVLLCLLFSGCGKEEKRNEEVVTTEEAIPEEQQTSLESVGELTLEDYLNEKQLLESPIREYGEEEGFIQMEDDMVVHILYPKGELENLDKVIEDWVMETVAYYQEESEGSSELGYSAELAAEYDSYVVNDEVVSIKMTGFYDRPYLAHPVDIIATFHANIQTGELITLEDVLLSDGAKLLQEKVVEDASVSEKNIDENLLEHWTLKNEGVEIILKRGDYLPMSEGTVTLLYPYDEITDIFSFQKELNEENISEEMEVQTTPGQELPASEINPEKPMVALTFDDGPSKHTERLLDIFATYGGKGTFFVVGNLLDGRAQTIQRMASEGHEIAGHSWNHRQLTKLSVGELTDQIMTTRAKIYEITGIDSTLIRPPYGSYNSETKSVCANLGIIMANWSLDTLDWKYKDANRIHNTIMKEVKAGDIILCHDLHGTTVDAMERVIPDLIEQGYQLVTVSELLTYSDKEIIAGGVYNNQ